MRRTGYLVLLLLVMIVGGMALAQDEQEAEEPGELVFRIEQELGRALPRKIIYDPNFERYAMVDAYSRLLFLDALTFETQHVLYEIGRYNDFQFSHDGRWLALAVGQHIELWDTDTGERVAMLDTPSEAISVRGPLTFNETDEMLVFYTENPAPRSLRQFENQTFFYPWLWHLPTARNESTSPFRGAVEAQPLFDYPFGFELGPEDRLVGALPGRLQVRDAYSLDLLYEIPTDRYQMDPLTLWRSALDNQIYVRPVDSSESLIQVDAQQGVLTEIPLNEPVTLNDVAALGVELSGQARLIGGVGHTNTNPLLSVFLGEYRAENYYGSRPLTVTLVDLVIPPSSVGDNVGVLLFVYEEDRRVGRFVLRTQSVNQLRLNPDASEIAVRPYGDSSIEVYDLTTGELLRSLVPSLRDLGAYSRTNKNRVLAYSADGQALISDFQRVDADTFDVLVEDLRYSRRFDRFFYTDDSQTIVTLSSTEWRQWSLDTAEVIRREEVDMRGEIVATSPDGHRFLSRFSDSHYGVQVRDLHENSLHTVIFSSMPGSSVQDVYWNSRWDLFFVTYTTNQYGPYTPGNQVAMYSLDDEQLWHIAGDDLPPADSRSYGWVDSDTVYIAGSGLPGSMPERVYGVDYAPNALPQCVVETYPEQINEWMMLWERLNYYQRGDRLDRLSLLICENVDEGVEAVDQLLIPTATPLYVSPTPPQIEGVPVCLTGRYPTQAEEYAEIWREITEGLNAEDIATMEALICEGIGEYEIRPEGEQSTGFTMMIDAHTGVRTSGSFTQPPALSRRPLDQVIALFERVMQRSLGTAILSPDAQTIASSNLPGELIIYALPMSYEQIQAPVTATAMAYITQQNLIRAQPSLTPTYSVIGTARPTLTPTVTPTIIPPPSEVVEDYDPTLTNFCPAETLFTMDNLPEGYAPTGRIIAPVLGDNLWTIDPANGRRREDESIIRCDSNNRTCTLSPDRQWILVQEGDYYADFYVVRPDNTDPRDLATSDNPDLTFSRDSAILVWSGSEQIQYPGRLQTGTDVNGNPIYATVDVREEVDASQADEIWIPHVEINEIPATIVSRQPGGPWAVVYTTFSTGISPGYKYSLYNVETGEDIYFARADRPTLSVEMAWHPFGDRLYWIYRDSRRSSEATWYEWDMTTMENRVLGNREFGVWSDDGRYVVYSYTSPTQPVAVWDSETGLTRTYCFPETGTRGYRGNFTWSPDSRYIAMQTYLPKDENTEGVGQHLVVLDTETGAMVDVTTGAQEIFMWQREPGTYGGN